MRTALNALGVIALGALFWLAWSATAGPDRLPGRVPTHFDAAGNPNAWGSPGGLYFLPILATIMFLAITVAAQFPHAFNYPVRPTPATLPRMQAVTLNLLAWIKTELVLMFLALEWTYIEAVHENSGRLFPKVVPVFIVAIFATIGWHMLAIARAARRG